MKVTRLEVFGFKSFMDRLILPLDSGITGVVGPNGCGKSNIVDALRWVLGETNAKHLRGTLLEDVIFNGTDSLRPLGLAEVTLTLRAAGDEFFGDLVSPSLEAELLATEIVQPSTNGTNTDGSSGPGDESDSLDPDEAALEGKHEFHLIEGGKDNSEEIALEAEVSDIPPTLLHKLSWLRSVNEVQVTRRLYRSGESEFFINRVPCRLRDLKDLFRAVGIGARTYTIVAQGEVSRIVTAKPEERRAILEEAAGVLGFRDKIAAAERRLNETDVNVSRIDDIIKEVTRQVNSLRQQAARARNRQSLRDDLRRVESTVYQDRNLRLKNRSAHLAAEITAVADGEESAHAALTKAQSEEEHARNELLRVDVEGDALRSQIDSIQEELNTRMRRRAEHASRIGEVEALGAAARSTIERLSVQQATLESRRDQAAQVIAELRTQSQQIGVDNLASSEINTAADPLRLIADELEAERKALRERERSLQETREELVRLTAELGSLEERLIPYSIIKAGEKGGSLPSILKGAKTLAEGLIVPEELTVAVEAALGGRARYLMVDAPHRVGKELSGELGRGADIDDLGVVEGGEGGAAFSSGAPGAVPFPRLIDRITVEKHAQNAASAALNGIYFAATAHEALNWLGSLPDGTALRGVKIVTPLGEILDQQSYAIASKPSQHGAIAIRKRIDEIKLRVKQVEEREELEKNERNIATERVSEREERQRQALAVAQERSLNARRIGSEQGVILGRLSVEERTLTSLEQDLESLRREILASEVQSKEMVSEASRVREEIASLTEDRERELEVALREIEGRNKEIEVQRRSGRDTLSGYIHAVNDARSALDSARERVSSLRLEEQKIALDQQHLTERIREEYGEEMWVEVSQAVPPVELSEEELAQLTEEASRLRSRLSREGEVNPEAIEQFDTEQKRLEDLVAQRRDLSQASLTLRKTIERLKETSVNRFLTTFEQVKENFSKLVPRLFGGGRGTLELLDPNNPLESGVEIIARPPGKKLKQLELLSGGEKAMCATALIFAMFLVRPSPLCVLDEVDAPLDEANLARFLSLVKEMSTKTQFIMITHNKQSMSAVDRLVGVTMEQPGASKLITVSLEEAYKQVA